MYIRNRSEIIKLCKSYITPFSDICGSLNKKEIFFMDKKKAKNCLGFGVFWCILVVG